jgi:hypothetical protein
MVNERGKYQTLVEKELLALSEHQSFSLFFKVEFMLCSALFSMLCLLTIVSSGLFCLMASGYPFGIFLVNQV